MKQHFAIEGPAPAAFLNANDRLHFRARAALVKLWRLDAWARYNAITAKAKPVGLATVQLEIGTKLVNQRRDPSNWMPTVKALIDGLTDARVWPDDDAERVTVAEPRFAPTYVLPDGHYRLTITWEIPDA